MLDLSVFIIGKCSSPDYTRRHIKGQFMRTFTRSKQKIAVLQYEINSNAAERSKTRAEFQWLPEELRRWRSTCHSDNSRGDGPEDHSVSYWIPLCPCWPFCIPPFCLMACPLLSLLNDYESHFYYCYIRSSTPNKICLFRGIHVWIRGII